eukprot:1852170-Amphidinium_carterae.3
MFRDTIGHRIWAEQLKGCCPMQPEWGEKLLLCQLVQQQTSSANGLEPLHGEADRRHGFGRAGWQEHLFERAGTSGFLSFLVAVLKSLCLRDSIMASQH